MINNLQKRTFITIINQNYVGFRELLGSNRVRIEPGLRLNVPVIHHIKKIPLFETGVNILDINCFTKDNVPVNVSGTLFTKVIDPEKACYNIDNYITSSSAIGTSSVRSIIGNFEYDHITSDRNIINKKLKEVVGDNILEWGIECTRFEIQNFIPSNKQIQHQLEKQMEAERNRRENELNTLAKIRTAEGDKLSQIHKAEAEFKTNELQTNAEVYKINEVTKATENQILKLKELLGDNTTNYLIELQKVKAFEKISESNNNKIYFMDSKGFLPSMNSLINEIKDK